MQEAPLYVPAELSRHGGAKDAPRWFRLAVAISPRHVLLRSALPEELREGPVLLRLHLPLEVDPPPPVLEVTGRAGEVVVDEGTEKERAEARRLCFERQALSDAGLALIERYIAHRLERDSLPEGT